MIVLYWIVSIFVISAVIARFVIFLDNAISSWTHAKKIIEEEPNPLSYWRISRLEYELFGQTFHNPDPAPYFGPCRCAACRYKVSPIDPKAAEAYAYGLPLWQDREGE